MDGVGRSPLVSHVIEPLWEAAGINVGTWAGVTINRCCPGALKAAGMTPLRCVCMYFCLMCVFLCERVFALLSCKLLLTEPSHQLHLGRCHSHFLAAYDIPVRSRKRETGGMEEGEDR